MAKMPMEFESGAIDRSSSVAWSETSPYLAKCYEKDGVVYIHYIGPVKTHVTTAEDIASLPSNLYPISDVMIVGRGTTNNVTPFGITISSSDGKITSLTSDTTSRRIAFTVSFLKAN